MNAAQARDLSLELSAKHVGHTLAYGYHPNLTPPDQYTVHVPLCAVPVEHVPEVVKLAWQFGLETHFTHGDQLTFNSPQPGQAAVARRPFGA